MTDVVAVMRSGGRGLLIAVMAGATMLLAGCITYTRTETLPPEQMGTIQGVVTFVGAPCAPNDPSRQTPPCSGPYQGYTVEVRNSAGDRVMGSAGTDHEGRYLINVPRGQYVIRTQNGLTPETFEEHRVTVNGGDTITLDLTVDTGIR